MVVETFGDMLFRPGSEDLAEFPSPASLKKRILISTKPPKEYLDTDGTKGKEGKTIMKETQSSRDKLETSGSVNEVISIFQSQYAALASQVLSHLIETFQFPSSG